MRLHFAAHRCHIPCFDRIPSCFSRTLPVPQYFDPVGAIPRRVVAAFVRDGGPNRRRHPGPGPLPCRGHPSLIAFAPQPGFPEYCRVIAPAVAPSATALMNFHCVLPPLKLLQEFDLPNCLWQRNFLEVAN